ncbi:MATE family efflux transporter [Peptacetobacter sp.]|uniref:MATE family efflux transporter n=1 Tax=Peptacetobacter sp. TaxID=2991975 RepID=UPI0026167E62|nr:MATE family efflux transporter [Peptacetobacter sp.]
MDKNKLAQNFNFYKLMKFSIPTMIMMIFMSLYQTIDGIFISNLVGELALTALNVVYPFSSVVIAIAVMLASGSSAIIAMNMGRGEKEQSRENFSFIILVAIILSICISILTLIFIKPFIYFLGATPKIYTLCYDYLEIMILSTPLATLQLLFQIFFVTAGKPKLGLILTVSSGIANIILDALFISIFNLGIRGAAIATSIGYSITAIFGIFYFLLYRNGELYFVKPKFRINVLLKSCINGSSEMVNNVAVAITTIIFNIVGIKFLREEGVAAISIVLYAQFFMTAVFIGYSNGIAPIFSYKYGADDTTQIKYLFKTSIKFIIVLSIFVFLLSFVVAKPIAMVFASNNKYVLDLAIHGFYLFSVSFLFTGINIFASSLFTAFSNGLVSGILSFLRTFIFLVVSLLLLPNFIGADGIWLAVPLAETVSIIFSVIFIYLYRKNYNFV